MFPCGSHSSQLPHILASTRPTLPDVGAASSAGYHEGVKKPLVDVIIPVHSADRPVERAAASVLNHTKTPLRLTVVAHNIDQSVIETRLGDLIDDPRLRILSLLDGVPSPAGPMNLGLAKADASYTSLLGSDDEFAPGAIDSWFTLAQSTGADAVLAKIQLTSGQTDPYPPVRCGRRTISLNGEADRLSFRSAPLGLISRDAFGWLRLTEGLKSGEDLVYSLTVWFTAQKLAYDLHGPAYVGHDDASDRVTADARPLDEDFAFLDHLDSAPWFIAASRSTRSAIAVKLIRIHMFDALRARLNSSEPNEIQTTDFTALFDRIEALAPGSNRLLSRADSALIDAVHASNTETERLRTLLVAREKYTSLAAILPRNLFFALHRQAPLRTLFAGLLIMRRA